MLEPRTLNYWVKIFPNVFQFTIVVIEYMIYKRIYTDINIYIFTQHFSLNEETIFVC